MQGIIPQNGFTALSNIIFVSLFGVQVGTLAVSVVFQSQVMLEI